MPGYGDDAGFATWLASVGLTVPATTAPAVLRQIGADYVDATYEARLQCSNRAAGFAQERAWPRVGHVVNGQAVPTDLIPLQWINASYRAAWLEANNPGWATAAINPARVTKREKTDVLEREFMETDLDASGAYAGTRQDAQIGAMVSAWLCLPRSEVSFGVLSVGS